MSQVAFAPKLGNPYVLEIEKLLDERSETIESLVISHDDALLTRKLSDCLNEPTAMLPIPQSTWGFADGLMLEAVCWALREGGFKQLIVVGHSQGGSVSSNAAVVGADNRQLKSEEDSSGASCSRLLAGAERGQWQLQQAKSYFAEQFQRLLDTPEVQNRIADGDLHMHGLFYLAESGIFLQFDPNAKDFIPLIGS